MTAPTSNSKLPYLENIFGSIAIEKKPAVNVSKFIRDEILWNDISIKIGQESVHIEASFTTTLQGAGLQFRDLKEERVIFKDGSNERIVFFPFSQKYPKPKDFHSFESLALAVLKKEESNDKFIACHSASHPFFSITYKVPSSNEKIPEYRIRAIATNEALFLLIAHEVDGNYSKETVHFLNSFKVD